MNIRYLKKITRKFLEYGAAVCLAGMLNPALAAGGYFALGYGPTARHLAGATTAYAEDAFAGASNPAKWLAAGNRVDIGGELFMPYRRVERTGSNTVYDFSTTSANDIFVLPEGAISRRINDRLAWGLSVYGNGGLNTEYRGNNGVPGSNFAPAVCGNKPSNFLLGCDKLGIDVVQLVAAPGVAYAVLPGHTIGIAPLLVFQRFEAYGLQGFAAFSKNPTDVSNRGWDWAPGLGVRVGWLGELSPRLSLGAAWASRVYMDATTARTWGGPTGGKTRGATRRLRVRCCAVSHRDLTDPVRHDGRGASSHEAGPGGHCVRRPQPVPSCGPVAMSRGACWERARSARCTRRATSRPGSSWR